MAVCFCIVILASCESHEKKVDDAFEQVRDERNLLKDNTNPRKEVEVKKYSKPDEWVSFKTETEIKLLTNEKKIKEIKNNANVSSSANKKLVILDKDNNDLRRQMDEYQEEVKVKLENFKAKINHDLNEIAIDLKDMKTNIIK